MNSQGVRRRSPLSRAVRVRTSQAGQRGVSQNIAENSDYPYRRGGKLRELAWEKNEASYQKNRLKNKTNPKTWSLGVFIRARKKLGDVAFAQMVFRSATRRDSALSRDTRWVNIGKDPKTYLDKIQTTIELGERVNREDEKMAMRQRALEKRNRKEIALEKSAIAKKEREEIARDRSLTEKKSWKKIATELRLSEKGRRERQRRE